MWGFRMGPWSLEHHPNSSFPPGRGRRRGSASRQRRSREPGRTVPLPMAARPPSYRRPNWTPRSHQRPSPARAHPPAASSPARTHLSPRVPTPAQSATAQTRAHAAMQPPSPVGRAGGAPSSPGRTGVRGVRSWVCFEPFLHPVPTLWPGMSHCPGILHPAPVVPSAARAGTAWPGDGSRTLPAASGASRAELGQGSPCRGPPQSPHEWLWGQTQPQTSRGQSGLSDAGGAHLPQPPGQPTPPTCPPTWADTGSLCPQI